MTLKKIANVVFIATALGFLTTYAAPIKQVKKHFRFAQDKPVVVKPGQDTFTITMPSNRTTGYRWYLAHYDHDLIEPENAKYVPSKSQLVGAGGNVTWTFKLEDKARKVPMITRMAFIYARGWDLKNSAVKRVWVLIE